MPQVTIGSGMFRFAFYLRQFHSGTRFSATYSRRSPFERS